MVLTGAGCSTESGIPDYRGTGAPKTHTPIQHREFITHEHIRQRYWARSWNGWPRIASARPNAGHHALADLERAGAIAGVITQNVDGLHQRAGSSVVVELHGGLDRVRCLECHAVSSRDEFQQRLAIANPNWRTDPHPVDQARPDGDAELTLEHAVAIPDCRACGGVVMPDVVFFGGSVPRPTLDAAWDLFGRGELLLVVGSSLAVFSGYRFVRRASERGIPVVIVNRGPTRGDPHAQLIVDAMAGATLAALRDRLVECASDLTSH